MPAVTTDAATVLLHYLHYSVLFRPDRRFAALTALDLDGARLQSSTGPTTGSSIPGWPPSCRPARRSTPTTTSTAVIW